MLFEFSTQLEQGLLHENELWDYLLQNWEVTPATRDEQRRGIDIHIKHREIEKEHSIEIKSDSRASITGNAFIETVSVDSFNKPGWAYTCTADFLFYYIPPDRLFYVLKPDWIKQKIKCWQQKYPTRKIKNISYNTIGLLVPLNEFEGKQKVSIPVTF